MARDNKMLGVGLIPWLTSGIKFGQGASNFLLGSPDTYERMETTTPEQQALHNSLISKAMGLPQGEGGYNLANQYYNNLLGGNQQEAYNQFAEPYLQQFQEQILPQIAERFAGAGALSSSGFGQSLGGAASGLQSQLAQLFSQLQNQAAGQQYGQYNQLGQQYNQLANTGLGHQAFGYKHTPGSQGFLGTLLGGLGLGLGGYGGAALGNGIGGGINSLFKSKPVAAKGGIE